MPTIVTKVSQQVGTYQSTFSCSVYASFSGLSGKADNANIRIFVPSWLTLSLNNTPSLLNALTEEPTADGKILVFDFATIEDLGVSISLGFGLSFVIGTPTGTSHALTPELWVNGELVSQSEGQTITLSLTPNFLVTQERILPTIAPAPNSQVYYRVTIENTGDLGATIQNLNMAFQGSNDFQLDKTYPVVGMDSSNPPFTDDSQDGVLGIIENNRLAFALPTYRGHHYTFIYRAILSGTIAVGSQISTMFSWAKEDEQPTVQEENFTVEAPVSTATLSLYGPRFTLPDQPINHGTSLSNTGNQPLQSPILQCNPPQQITLTSLLTPTFHLSAIDQPIAQEYQLTYSTQQGNTGTLGTFSTATAQRVSLENSLSTTDRFTAFFARFSQLDVGASTKSAFQFDGIVDGQTPLETTFTKNNTLTWNDGKATATKDTLVSNTCSLLPIGNVSPGGSTAKIGDILRYTIGANCSQSRLNNPIFAALLPKELTYIGNASLQCSAYFPEETPLLPAVTLIEQGGQTLVQFAFTDQNSHTFHQKSTVRISFDTQVNIGALGTFTVSPLLNLTGATPFYPNSATQYQTAWMSTPYATRYAYEKTILFLASIAVTKQAKGNLDSDFLPAPQVAKATQCGFVDYWITIINNGNATLDTVEVIDILPHIGDNAIINPWVERGSQFPVHPCCQPFVTVLPSHEIAQFQLYHSTSTDPIRFGNAFNTIGSSDNWNSFTPSDFTDIHSIKVTTQHTKLLPNQSLMVAFRGTVPLGVVDGQTAWNSCAVDVSYTSLQGQSTHLLATECEMVGLTVTRAPSNRGTIGGFAFLDTQEDGIYQPSASRVNDVGVMLYDGTDTLVSATFTAPDMAGNNGYFRFTNLDLTTYRLVFVVNHNQYVFTTPDTLVVDLTQSPTQLEQLVGLAKRNPIDQVLAVNHSARQMMRTVSYNQMAIGMKLDSLLELLADS